MRDRRGPRTRRARRESGISETIKNHKKTRRPARKATCVALIGYGYGSEWHLLYYLGRRRAAFTRRVQEKVGCVHLQWCDHEEYVEPTPVRGTGLLKVRERRGLDFLAPCDPVRQEWERQWPQSGNVQNWDALGKATRDGKTAWILLEAKAHLAELTSSCAATAEDSVRRIREVLDQTRRELGVTGQTDWSRDFYQYCNRLALLHFLRTHGVDAHLVFLYFTGDRMDLGGTGRQCPATSDEWGDALKRQDEHVGLPATTPIQHAVHLMFLPAYHAKVDDGIARVERT